MDVLIVLVFVSLLFVCGSILLLCVSLHQRDFEHSDRLALLPFSDPAARASASVPEEPASASDRDPAS